MQEKRFVAILVFNIENNV